MDMPVIFPSTIVHSDMALMLSQMIELYGWKNKGVLSAGFLDFGIDSITVHGGSDTLNLENRGQADIDIIESYTFMHGISDIPEEFRAKMLSQIRAEWRKRNKT